MGKGKGGGGAMDAIVCVGAHTALDSVDVIGLHVVMHVPVGFVALAVNHRRSNRSLALANK